MNWSKRELKRAKKEKKRCAKMYKDWIDNEYNCGPLKFVFAVVAEANSVFTRLNLPPSFNTLNNLTISYNRDTQKYILDIDPAGMDMQKDSLIYLHELLDAFKSFLAEDLDYDLSPFACLDPFAYLKDLDYFVANTLGELYYRFYIFIAGYEKLIEKS